jgi:hypothetical protein
MSRMFILTSLNIVHCTKIEVLEMYSIIYVYIMYCAPNMTSNFATNILAKCMSKKFVSVLWSSYVFVWVYT